MKWIRYVVGAIAFLLVFIVVTLVVTLVLSIISRPADGQVDLLTNWRAWIGLGLGLVAGLQSWNASADRGRK